MNLSILYLLCCYLNSGILKKNFANAEMEYQIALGIGNVTLLVHASLFSAKCVISSVYVHYCDVIDGGLAWRTRNMIFFYFSGNELFMFAES